MGNSMQIRHRDIDIPQDKPFENCKLSREKYGNILTDIVNAYSNGFVLAINNEWGTGKTTFVKMWRQMLENNGFETIYFNAWENDFTENPMIAMMSELKTLTKVDDKKQFNSVLEKGAILTKNVLPSLVKALAKRYIDIDEVSGAIESISRGATEILEEEIKEYANKKRTISEFKNELESYIKARENKHPIVFIIDELDRCRPDYAVQVLEQMKHFFEVERMVFVLSIDKEQLANAVRGFYGSDLIKADEYLRRFIDLEYSIPTPQKAEYCLYLYDYYGFDEFFKSAERVNLIEFGSEAQIFLNVARTLLVHSDVTLRQQEKILGLSRLVINTIGPRQNSYAYIIVILLFLKVKNNELYRKIENNRISLQEFSDVIVDLFSNSDLNKYGINRIYIQALLLHAYNNSQPEGRRKKLLERIPNGQIIATVKSNMENDKDGAELSRNLDLVIGKYDYEYISLERIINKINLSDKLVFN